MYFNADQKIWTSANFERGNFINQSLGEIFLQTMRSIDEHKILEYHYDTGLEKTTGEIYREAVTVAKNLQRLGIQRGDVITLYSLSNDKIAPLTAGCYLIGAAINFFDTKFCEEYIDHTLQLLEPKMICFEENYRENLQTSLKRSPLPSLKHLLSIDAVEAPNVITELFCSIPAQEIAQFQSVQIEDPKLEPAILLLTSGSSGVPKVAILNHATILFGLTALWWETTMRAKPNNDSIIFSMNPLRWIGPVAAFNQSLLFGIKRICVSKDPKGVYAYDVIRTCKVTHYIGVPGLFYDALCEVNNTDEWSSLEVVLIGGEPMPEVVHNLTKQLAEKCCIIEAYGMTELSGSIVNNENLAPGLKVKILNNNMQPVGPNERGQFCFLTPAPFKGYLKRDNRQYFTDDGYFISGDYGYIDGHNKLKCLSRYKDIVRTKNAILVPQPIECIVNSLFEVSNSCLVGSKKLSTDDDEICALFVELKEKILKDTENIRTKILNILAKNLKQDELSAIKNIYFRNEFPLLTCGKIDRTILKTQFGKILQS